ncbi:ProQ/FINO family protein [Candidatus Paracaedibacter symbiosus]|uniref:ProQ/FINO family protein n=1 Tax=Candidatus Paracaedibacter symbiosus TaxID=244582 RepID=UPI00068AF365|nr:ProQ/FinO family protein [Candidatus Paracaedibacter symbiosus]
MTRAPHQKPPNLKGLKNKNLKQINRLKNTRRDRKEKAAKAKQHALIIKKEQQEARQQRSEKTQNALGWLHDTYPNCFNWDEPKPLKKRIEKDIFATLPEDLPFPRLAIRWAIAYYAGAPRYLDALSKSQHRFDLQGEPVEEVIPEHQQRAEEQLLQYIERKKRFYAEKKERRQAWKQKMKEKKACDNQKDVGSQQRDVPNKQA